VRGQELSDEAFADLLKKHKQLKESLGDGCNAEAIPALRGRVCLNQN
jgi:hypothetical protein